MKAAGFIRDQSDEIASKPFFEKMIIGGSKQEQRAIADIETATGLTFPGLAAVDTLVTSERRAVPLVRSTDAIL